MNQIFKNLKMLYDSISGFTLLGEQCIKKE